MISTSSPATPRDCPPPGRDREAVSWGGRDTALLDTWDAVVAFLIHPGKVAILEAMRWIGRPISATDMERIANRQPGLSSVAYHMANLAERRVIALIRKREVRGATENFYFLRCPTITVAQRDALRDQVIDRLSSIGDIELAVQSGDYMTAERIGAEYSDDLRLFLDDLQFGDEDEGDEHGSDEPVALTTPPEVLRRVLPRLHKLAESYSASLEPERAKVRETRERNQLVSEACEAVMSSLDEFGTAG